MLKKNILFLLFALSSMCYSQKIDQSKEELNRPKEDTRPPLPTEPVSQNSGTTVKQSNDNFGIGAFFVELGFYVFLYSAIGDYRNEDHLYNPLSPYPYFNGKSGNYEKIDDTSIKKKQLRWDVENHFLYNSNRSFGNHFKGKIRPFNYFYLQGDYRELFEKNSFTHQTSNLSLFQFNFGYDRLRFEKFNLGWTLGATYIGNEVNKFGFSYGLNTDVFIIKNISFTGAMIWSKINELPVNSLEIRSKYHRKNYFISIGYENLKIASPSYNYISLGTGIYW